MATISGLITTLENAWARDVEARRNLAAAGKERLDEALNEARAQVPIHLAELSEWCPRLDTANRQKALGGVALATLADGLPKIGTVIVAPNGTMGPLQVQVARCGKPR